MPANSETNINMMSIIDMIFDTDDNNKNLTLIENRICLRIMPDEANTITLDDCYNIAKRHGYKIGTITVMNTSPLGGEVFTYGNHGPYWEQTGTLTGYA